MKITRIAFTALALALAGVGVGAFAQQQGVSKNEILVGTIQDLSGPLAGYVRTRSPSSLRKKESNWSRPCWFGCMSRKRLMTGNGPASKAANRSSSADSWSRLGMPRLSQSACPRIADFGLQIADWRHSAI